MAQQTEFIPYEQALDLKELGFNEPCIAIYDFEKDIYYPKQNLLYTLDMLGDTPILAPLYQQAFRWFRKKYELNQTIGVTVSERLFIYIVEDISTKETRQTFNPTLMGRYKTYEEAELACLKKLIEIVKNK